MTPPDPRASPPGPGDAIASPVPSDTPSEPVPGASPAHPLSPFPWRPSPLLLQRLVFAAMLVALLALKLRFAATGPGYGPDGSYYYDIAVHVRDGHGLVTDVSLFNAGFSEFPHATAIYPLWPLLLGLCGRLVPIDLAAVWLPTLLYFAILVLAYRLARRCAPGPLFPETWPVVHAGHVAAALLALTNAMFFHTSKPFTEGLGFFLLLLALTRAEAFFRDPRAWRGAELGVLLGLVILARSQLVLGALAMTTALAWAVLRLGWRRWLPPALAFMAGLWTVLGAQLVHLASFADAPRLAYLLRFDLVREPSELAPLRIMIDPGGPLAWLADRAAGLPVAFGAGPMSYFHCFGLWSHTLLVALPFLLLDLGRAARTRGLARAWAWLHDPRNLFTLFFGLLAAAGLLSLHTIHKAVFTPWNFGSRHALTAVFAVFAAVLYLARRPVLGRVLALFFVCASAYFGFWRIENAIREPHRDTVRWRADTNADIVAWLHARAAAEPGLVVAAPDIEVQKLARFTEGVGYHWYFWNTTWDEIDFLFRERGVRYVIVRDDNLARSRLARHPQRFARTLIAVERGLSGYSVYRHRVTGDPLGELPRAPGPGPDTDTDRDD